MPFTAKQYYTCRRKNSYPSREAAEVRAEIRKPYFAWPLYIYRCPVCSGYHLTKMPPNEVKTEITKLEQQLYAQNSVRYLMDAALKVKYA